MSLTDEQRDEMRVELAAFTDAVNALQHEVHELCAEVQRRFPIDQPVPFTQIRVGDEVKLAGEWHRIVHKESGDGIADRIDLRPLDTPTARWTYHPGFGELFTVGNRR